MAANPKQKPTGAAPKKRQENFHAQLVLNRWVVKFFGGNWGELQQQLMKPGLEGMAEDGQTRFFQELTHYRLNSDRLPEHELRRYDGNVARYWGQITERRNREEDAILNMKYFQYLSLIFTELYLDWYFHRPDELLDALNLELAEFNDRQKDNERFMPFTEDDLNKLAFWSATGSGKTLLMHVNWLQYRDYFKAKWQERRSPPPTYLLTPNEGLSKQHLLELEKSGFINAEFKKNTSLSSGINVLCITKLADTDGPDTVAIDRFEGDNLVLVDEGHRGTGTEAGKWLERREKLCATGFAFEYSATFGQAVAKSKTVRQELAKKKIENPSPADIVEAQTRALRETYGKCILFDYSYKFFYHDGYGKDSQILNLPSDYDAELRQNYLTACLLSFYQQLWLHREKHEVVREFNIHKPLLVFVGNKVNDDNSDVFEVVQFLGRFVRDAAQTQHCIQELVTGQSRLLDTQGRRIFENRFQPLNGRAAGEIYQDMLQILFNSANRQELHVVNLKSGGEIALRLGDADPFGLINIGDTAAFMKLCDEKKPAARWFKTDEDSFGSSLFSGINAEESRLNVLIGSRKFTEGWSSWRVSTMGLLNMGRGEGSQIIQLFGRGVRLKGRDFSLKRSKPTERPTGSWLNLMETLNVFGIRADYMLQFKEYLREEGVTPSDEMLEVCFETRRNAGNGNLLTIGLEDGYKDNQVNGFRRTQRPCLFAIPEHLKGKIRLPKARLDLYPRIQSLNTDASKNANQVAIKKHDGKLRDAHFAFMDFDRVYLRLLEYKNQQGWYNLKVSKDDLEVFCRKNSWYVLEIPAPELELTRFCDVRKWEGILVELLDDYTRRYYDAVKRAYESKFIKYVPVAKDSEAFISMYSFEIDDNDDGRVYEERLKELKSILEKSGTDEQVRIGEVSKWNANHMVAICFDRHLFYPLLYIDKDANLPLRMRPLAFNASSEVQFVKDLQTFYGSPAGKKYFAGKDLYLLRNAADRKRGVGFVTAGNYYPDFLLWVIDGDRQYLAVVDPKGIHHLNFDDPKFQLYSEIKNVQKTLQERTGISVELSSFILSDTKFDGIVNNPFETPAELEPRHVLFMDEGPERYLPKLFDRMLG